MLLNLCCVIYTLTGTWQQALQTNICSATALENVSILLIFLLFSAGLFSSLILGDCREIVAIRVTFPSVYHFLFAFSLI